ncbi:hypothetical protein GCM10007939_14690 [Amylibacter marinus]|uniref:Uncharacterized protein n=1 Tax=Amylibacter marinus TaxID=1475483 RepID=A0ABQ5VVA9_9RHOB|nr:hypothetical protein GCM10007939_14690 [Amylibacter marinus]
MRTGPCFLSAWAIRLERNRPPELLGQIEEGVIIMNFGMANHNLWLNLSAGQWWIALATLKV